MTAPATGATMKLFVLGAPCSGKSTVAMSLRSADIPVIDVDDEVVRRNEGTWPDIDTKNELLGHILADAAALPAVVVLNSYLPLDRTAALREDGFAVALLDVAPDELRRRDARRLAEEGWTNIEWFDWHQSVIRDHLDAGLVDHVVDGDRPPADVAADLLALVGQLAR